MTTKTVLRDYLHKGVYKRSYFVIIEYNENKISLTPNKWYDNTILE